MIDVYIRPLEEKDAYTSVLWRNNPEIWKYTGSRPDQNITLEMELTWIKEAIKRPNEKRFAICIAKNDTYVGNVQLTHITKTEAQFHIFIGESDYWGKGIGTSATGQLLKYGMDTLALSSIYLYVNEENKAAIKSYLNNGFEIEGSEGNQIKMVYNKS
ncbi:GNAT family N-acetyltransferase [Flagellimonas okinawensis]|uniref:GNAT family protein n=1 Tax=Flagellimonas okinawensis TaxID=3031324 RepID=A0ABT5XQZ9_9FLAO|nr:GNAT family protein [[Muricauda] okinawensis]MDF0708330.1 GNAT family protein [[Muricauda] okinawensis]